MTYSRVMIALAIIVACVYVLLEIPGNVYFFYMPPMSSPVKKLVNERFGKSQPMLSSCFSKQVLPQNSGDGRSFRAVPIISEIDGALAREVPS